MSVGELAGETMTVTGTGTRPGPGAGAGAGAGAILQNVSVRVRSGEILGVTGPSGSGKTTLLLALGGLLPLAAGRLSIDGRDAVPWRDASTAIVFQNLCLAPMLSAQETVGLPLQAKGARRGEVEARSRAILEHLGLGDHTAQLVAALSGGQRQRVAVARAVAAEADVILADEPVSALDEQWRDVVLELFVREAARGAAVILASGDPAVLAVCGERVTLAAR